MSKDKKIDVAFVDDWHSYPHVKRQLELLDELVGPSSIILMHDLMYGNTDPFYHVDLSHHEGQWASGGISCRCRIESTVLGVVNVAME